MIRAASTVFLSSGAGTAFSFLRNVLIGRMVSAEDFGIVSTFALAFSIIQTVTYAGFDRMLVQAKDGGDETFQANLQFLQVLRGLAGAVFFLIFAWPYAWFLGNTDIYWAYLVMSVVPLLRGFIHFDIYRLQRTMDFLPTALVTTGAPFVSLLVTLVLLPFVDDYRIILIAIVAQQIVFVALSHRFAERRWVISWDLEVSIRAVRFGLPLLLNGLLVFAIHNGELMLVGGYFDMQTLGMFYVAMLLTVTMSLHLDTTVRSITLPGLSRAQEDPALFARRASETVEMSTAAALLILGAVHLFGPAMVLLLFGPQYEAALVFILPLGVLYAIKTLKSGPNTIALATARTKIPVYTNLPRGVSLFVSAYLLSQGAELFTIIAVAIVGEIICVALAYYFAIWTAANALPLKVGIRSLVLFSFVLIVVALDGFFYPAQAELSGILPWTRLPVACLGLAVIALLPSLRNYVRRKVFQRS